MRRGRGKRSLISLVLLCLLVKRYIYISLLIGKRLSNQPFLPRTKTLKVKFKQEILKKISVLLRYVISNLRAHSGHV
jgi:hypothetical protein